MSNSLPERPDLDQLRRQAKELRDAARRGDPDGVGALRPPPPVGRSHRARPRLAAAQLVIARELGFASWPSSKPAVDADAGCPATRSPRS